MRIRKAIFPVAGLGTRFLPATKASPKEMLAVVDKPIIQYAVEEAVEAGITELIFVTSITKRAIEDHFDTNYELEDKLKKAGQERFLEVVRNIIPKHVSCAYIRQPEALGLGHAVLCAKPLIGGEPFAVLLADDLIYSPGVGCLSSMVKIVEDIQNSIVAIERVSINDVKKYGIIASEPMGKQLHRLQGIVEKPAQEDAPSNLAVVGRYVLMPEIFSLLESTLAGANGEIQLTDAIAAMMAKQQVLAYEFEGKRYDCGSKLGYLTATVEYGLRHPELSEEFDAYLKERYR
ncbi:MAG: UTP--glucose-1-phosphate uridylyltransferase GalU [Anaerolineae bacterium]|nr:UTP--glucose-1-phosphate uridylyltransferase GalU [Anaerolineae bacterium]MCB1661418.1 UTP--glucose-1-phosphate uridylyltransferase GalU [Pseudomonadales bacterium]MCP5214145.1 UTP--glucose-1-phosphate uridylyltransferase GalU [Pseudomonadales bacterium]MCP5302661.1 UTP--glucose-1-phosphate uridylyltransferase GalU [Pseudomonadales bacterium]